MSCKVSSGAGVQSVALFPFSSFTFFNQNVLPLGIPKIKGLKRVAVLDSALMITFVHVFSGIDAPDIRVYKPA